MGTVKEFVTTTRAVVKAGMAGKPMPDGKYEVLTGEKHTVVVDGVKYHRIRALRRFERPFGLPPVEVGDLRLVCRRLRWVTLVGILLCIGVIWVMRGLVGLLMGLFRLVR